MSETDIKVGDGATMICGSDRYPATIIEIKTPRKMKVQMDDYKPLHKDVFSETQRYEYSPNPKAEVYVITLRKNGRWIVSSGCPSAGTVFAVGVRNAYYDPHF